MKPRSQFVEDENASSESSYKSRVMDPVSRALGNIMEITLRELPEIMGSQGFWGLLNPNK